MKTTKPAISISIFLLCAFFLVPHNSHSQWVQTNGPYGGAVECFASSGSNIYAGIWNGGVFLSTNNGTSWTWVNNGLTKLDLYSLAVSGQDVFAGTSEGGVFRSTNNGLSWTDVSIGSSSSIVMGLVVLGTNLFAGTYGDGIFLSTNNGSSWKEVNKGLRDLYVRTLAVSGTNIFAGTLGGGGIFRSTDNGLKWKSANSGLKNYYVYSIVSDNSGHIYAGTFDGIFRSDNDGKKWNDVSPDSPDRVAEPLVVYPDGAGGTYLFAYITGLYAGAGVFRSTNNGESWEATGLQSARAFGVTPGESGSSNLFAGNGAGVKLSTDNGSSWNAVNNGITGTAVYAFTSSGTHLYTGTSSGVFYTTNSGVNWNPTSLSYFIYSLAVNEAGLFAGTYGGALKFSSDNGVSWVNRSAGLFTNTVMALAVIDTFIFAANQNIGSGGGVYFSTNNGKHWYLSGLTDYNITAFAVSGSKLYAGGYSLTGGGVFLSTDYGTSWRDISIGLTPNFVYSLASDGSNLFAGTSLGGAFRSIDDGASWTDISSGLPNYPVFTLVVSGANLFACPTGGGIFVSTNYGTNWTDVNSGLTNLKVYAFSIEGSNLFAGTLGSGVWMRDLSEMTSPVLTALSKRNQKEIPGSFSLGQNYPNPFNPSTTIKFSLPKSTFVKLTVYDVTGKEIHTLVNEQMNAGTYSVDFDATKLSSGTYLYKIETSEFSNVKKMVLIK